MPRNNRGNVGKDAGKRVSGQGGVGPAPKASLPGDPQVIGFLNTALKNELTAISQYFLHSRMLADWGISELAKKEREESIDEMKHADRLIQRILFLGGLPNLQNIGKLQIGENLKEVISCDLALEQHALPDLQSAIVHCERIGDYVSRELFVDILKSEEDHIDFLQTQFRLVEQMGIENYAQLQTKPNAAGAAS
ncbi:MAG TPA: bacterioferritin [Rhizomicrobium sp.]